MGPANSLVFNWIQLWPWYKLHCILYHSPENVNCSGAQSQTYAGVVRFYWTSMIFDSLLRQRQFRSNSGKKNVMFDDLKNAARGKKNANELLIMDQNSPQQKKKKA